MTKESARKRRSVTPVLVHCSGRTSSCCPHASATQAAVPVNELRVRCQCTGCASGNFKLFCPRSCPMACTANWQANAAIRKRRIGVPGAARPARPSDSTRVMCGVKQGYSKEGYAMYCHEYCDFEGCGHDKYQDHIDRRRFACRGRAPWRRLNGEFVYRWCTRTIKGGVKPAKDGGKPSNPHIYCHQHQRKWPSKQMFALLCFHCIQCETHT